MRNTCAVFSVLFALALASCDSDDRKFLLPKNNESTGTTADVINDTTDTGEFRYRTIHDVSFDIRVYDELKNFLPKAVIRVTTEHEDVTNAVTSGNGIAVFKISVTRDVELVSLIIEHPGCVTKTIDIDMIQDLAAVNRSVYLELKKENKPKPDRDGDGVADDADEFPDDPYLIGTARGEYTIAFEDMYPRKGDADFNDCVVRLGIKEYIDNNNMVSRIVITAKALAAGAAYTNQFWITVLNKDYSLIVDPKKDLGGSWNDRKGETFVEGPVHTLDIPLETPVARDILEPMPYDPYILCNGDIARQAHLPFVKTKFAGSVLDSDNFPWAILVPSDWAWPYERTQIEAAYGGFNPWYMSKGAEHGDWYLHPEVDRVYKISATTILTAYLMKASFTMSTGIILGILTVILLAVAGMNFWRKRRDERIVSREQVHN